MTPPAAAPDATARPSELTEPPTPVHPGAWILFGLAAALNLVVASVVSLFAVLSLTSFGEDDVDRWSALPFVLAMLVVVGALVVATSWHLVRLKQGRPSLLLGAALLLPAVTAWSLGNV